MSWDDWAFLAVGGLLLGCFLNLARMTLKMEPWAKSGYAFIGLGVAIANVAQLWVQFHVNASYWFMFATTLAYTIIVIGLGLLIRARRTHYKERKVNNM